MTPLFARPLVQAWALTSVAVLAYSSAAGASLFEGGAPAQSARRATKVLRDAATAESACTAGDELAERFTGFDQDGDGRIELARVRPLYERDGGGETVLLLVEERLCLPLREGGDAGEEPRVVEAHEARRETAVRSLGATDLLDAEDDALDLLPAIERLVDDLAAEGRHARALSVALAPSELHQDGRYVLALRELLRAQAVERPLAGALLIGHFPDALLVRTCNWRKQGKLVLRAKQPNERVFESTRYLRRVSEDVAHKADIVLSDLDGRWENVYVQSRTRVEAVTAAFDGAIPTSGGACLDLERSGRVFEDFFHVSDGKLEVLERLDADDEVVGHELFLDDRSGDHECSAEDRTRSNVIARPDIVVSRLDARGTALRPRRDLRDRDGAGLLDEEGRPRALEFDSAEAVPHWRSDLWERDPVLERELLLAYFDRNHAYRRGEAPIAWRPSSIACDLGSGYRVMARAADDWVAGDERLADVSGQPDLGAFVDWMRYPAVLRTLRAHSDPWGSVFGKATVASYAERVGGPAWSWTQRDARLEPSLDAACGGGKLDWFLLRSLWENGALATEPAFYHHTGCHGISPPDALKRAFDDERYGLRQGAEALLFYGNGLALVGRAKVFYDEPRGFAEALAEGETFGGAWARYFELESSATSWGRVGGDIGRKRSYFWSVIGDWTLRLSTAAPKRASGSGTSE